jgi:hypothetical protein
MFLAPFGKLETNTTPYPKKKGIVVEAKKTLVLVMGI